MIIRPVLLTTYSAVAFNGISCQTFAKKYPQLLHIGFEVQDMDREMLFNIISRGDLTQATTPSGVVVSASYRIWRAVLPSLLADKATAEFAAQVNAILAKNGLSCR